MFIGTVIVREIGYDIPVSPTTAASFHQCTFLTIKHKGMHTSLFNVGLDLALDLHHPSFLL